MRRTALYLGGLFLATGATLAMAAPAQAAEGKCPRDYLQAVAVDYGHGHNYYGGGYGGYVPVGYPVGGYGGSYNGNISSYEATNQVGLVNVNKSPISLLGTGYGY